MLNKSISTSALVLAAATIAFTVSHSNSAHSLTGLHAKIQVGGKMCFASHEHTGYARVGGSKRAAVQAAVRDWTSFTKLEYGSQWANFRQAHRRRMACRQAGHAWSCKVIASPCRG